MKYLYQNKSINSDALSEEFKKASIEATFYTSVGNLTVITEAVKSDVDTVVNAHSENSLLSKKFNKKKIIQANSSNLLNKGIEITIEAGTDVFSIENVRESFAFYESLVSAAKRDSSKLPQSIPSISKQMSFKSIEEIELLANAAEERYIYIYTNIVQNDDDSYSEAALSNLIMAAADETELDSILDTRT